MGAWDGVERRENKDHDLLIKIVENTQHTKEWCIAHKIEDDERYRENIKKFDKIDSSLQWQSKILWGAVGAFSLVMIIVRYIH